MHQFDPNSLTEEELGLFRSFPLDYQAFLQATNGSILNSPNRWFRASIERTFNGQLHTTTWNAVEQFWVYVSYHSSQQPEADVNSILHEHHDRHVNEGFLPQGVYAIGSCIQNSLLCISTNTFDFGVIYYWEWYWQYPWYKPFFERRIAQVSRPFTDTQAVLGNPNHPEYVAVYNALNYATLIKISDSFSDFINDLLPESAVPNEG